MKQETIRFLLTAILWGLALFGAAVLLTGCQSARDEAKFAECLMRDGTSNPCS